MRSPATALKRAGHLHHPEEEQGQAAEQAYADGPPVQRLAIARGRVYGRRRSTAGPAAATTQNNPSKRAERRHRRSHLGVAGMLVWWLSRPT